MSTKEIQYLLQNISELHHSFEKKSYQLTLLDIHSLKNLLEQLHLKIIAQTDHYQQPIESNVIPQPKPDTSIHQQPLVKESEAKDSTSQPDNVDQLNEEIDEVFSPEPVQQVMSSNVERDSFQLGINERIMFAKELFNDDVTAMQETIRKLKSFETKEEALDYFENTFTPYLVDEGKDEEVIAEFQQILHRIY